MNIIESKVLLELSRNDFKNQRNLSEATNYSVGSINNALKYLNNEKYIDDEMQLTNKAKKLLDSNKPERAIILAAGVGTRMIPINHDYSKGMLVVHNETLVERLIKQLKEVDINEIFIVVGFMKEQYEYLIDKYNVNLVVNEDYRAKNNLYSLSKVVDRLSNAYIVPCDIYCRNNPFDKVELHSWYMLSESKISSSVVRVNRKEEIVTNTKDGNQMIGIAYINREDASSIQDRIKEMCQDDSNVDLFWEDALTVNNKMFFNARVVDDSEVVEINTYEQLRDLDNNSPQLDNDIINTIKSVFNVSTKDIDNIHHLKKGMTNRSFTFECKGKKYIMRVPGEGTDMLIDRKKEAAVYNAILDKGICDNVIYIDPESGYKITEYINDLQECDAFNKNDLIKCMKRLKEMHNMNLKVDYEFDLFGQIDYYEDLRNCVSIYPDYKTTKSNVLKMKKFIDSNKGKETLTHIDAICDNFLFAHKNTKDEKIYLIDWEYSGMQDPYVDIAMFGIYSLYDRRQMDELIDIYFENECSQIDRFKIYCYVAACGLLWSNWCEYKYTLGFEYGEYSLRQYRYAKEYYKIFEEEYLEKVDE